MTQAFADIANVVIVQITALTSLELDQRVQTTLAGRTVIEQAKGILAQATDVDMAESYKLLVQRAHEDGASLTEPATRIIRHAQRRR